MRDVSQLLVRLTPEQVLSRLNTSLVREKNFGRYDKVDQIVGGIWGNAFDLRMWRGSSSKHNALYLKGLIEPISEGSRIRTWMGFHPVTKVFMTFWFVIMGVVWLVALLKGLPSRLPSNIKLISCLVPPIFGLIAALALASIRTRGRTDEGALKAFIEKLFTDVKIPEPERGLQQS